MSLSVTIAIAAVLVILYVIAAKWHQNYWKRKGAPQTNPNLIFGDFMAAATGRESLYDIFKKLYFYGKKAGHSFFGVYSFWAPELVIIDRELVKTILLKDFSYFTSHGTFHDESNPLTMHMFNMEGQEWKDRRTKMTPLFTTGKLKSVFGTLTEKSSSLTKYLNQHADEKRPVNIKDAIARFTTDNITNVVFGINTDSFTESNPLFRKLGDEISKPRKISVFLEKLFSYRTLGKLGYKIFPVSIANAFSDVIMDTVKFRETNNVKRNDFMDLMLELKKYGSLNQDNGSNGTTQKDTLFLDDKEIVAESFLFFFAGFDTSSSTTTFALFEMARHPDIQEKCREDILRVLKKYDGQVTYEGLFEMTYLDQVTKETLRIYPIVSFVPRECTQSYKIPGTNIVVEKGTKIHIPISGIQQDPEYYDNPEVFNPENFSQEKIDQRPDYTWLPFGSGPRQCIGMRLGLIQAKLGIIAALRDFRITHHESMKPPFKTSPGSILVTFVNDPMLNITRL